MPETIYDICYGENGLVSRDDTVLPDIYSPGLKELDAAVQESLGTFFGPMVTREDSFIQYLGWMYNSQGSLDVVPETKGIALYEAVEGQLTGASAVKAVNPRRVGEAHSRQENVRQAAKNAMVDEVYGVALDAYAWIEFLKSEGYVEENIPSHVGAKDMPEYANVDGTIEGVLLALTGATNLYQKSENDAGDYKENLTALEKFTEYAYLHEIGHLSGVHGEEKMGKLMAKFYNARKELHKGTDKEKLYEQLEKQAEEYAKSWSLGNRLLNYFKSSVSVEQLSQSELESLIDTYRTEALMVNTNDVESYVRNKVEQYIKDSKKGDEGKGSKSSSKSSKSKYEKNSKGGKEDKDSEDKEDEEDPDNEEESEEDAEDSDGSEDSGESGE